MVSALGQALGLVWWPSQPAPRHGAVIKAGCVGPRLGGGATGTCRGSQASGPYRTWTARLGRDLEGQLDWQALDMAAMMAMSSSLDLAGEVEVGHWVLRGVTAGLGRWTDHGTSRVAWSMRQNVAGRSRSCDLTPGGEAAHTSRAGHVGYGLYPSPWPRPAPEPGQTHMPYQAHASLSDNPATYPPPTLPSSRYTSVSPWSGHIGNNSHFTPVYLFLVIIISEKKVG